MRFYLTVLLLVVNCLSWAQFSDDFLDGDFTASPSWSGETSNFIVNASHELQLSAPAAADTSYLSVATTSIDDVTWDFFVRMEFNPSSSNYTRVYLVSDNSDLKGSLNGYYVMIGNTADEISLYSQTGTAVTEILDGIDNTVDMSTVETRVRVTRDVAGNWELFRDTTGGYNFVSEGTVNDMTHTVSTNFGVFCKYTATRSTLFYFDNIGDPYIDLIAPTLDGASVISDTEIDLQFSEAMDQTTAETISNYSVNNGIGTPTTAIIDGADASIVHLTFGTNFSNGITYMVTANNVEDLAGNSISSPSTEVFFYFVPETPAPNDVIITEFVADPSPQVGLPEVEYVEIYNRSNKFFDLAGWTLSDGSSSGSFSSYVLAPLQYVLICNTGDCGQFFVSNSTELTLPSLNNSGDAIVIKDDLGNTLDSINYSTAWYNDTSKDDGGWSIERKHLNTPCSDINNWSASVDVIGGTPALQNSVWTDVDDTSPPYVTSYLASSNTDILLFFNETLDTTVAADISINPSITSLSWVYTDEMTLHLTANSLDVNVPYDVIIGLAEDCWGNALSEQTIMIGLPDSVTSEDIILNEIMFNPLTNGSDYVELYNNSEKILDLQNLFIADWDDDSIGNYKQITSTKRLLLPKEYVLITEDTADIINDFSIYGLGTFVETDLPTFPNDSGTVYLLSKDSLVLDYFHYDEDFHFELLTSEDGKALERINFGGGMNNPDNWHTAAEDVEWGTPGYENSQLYIPSSSGNVSIDPKIFSPDNDGYQDVLTINLEFQSTENVVDIEIFDNRGRLIRLLKDNFFAGNSTIVTWDGINDEGEKAAVGSYVILVSVLDDQNEQTQYKLVTVLAAKM
jgi:hypothetical protein